LILGRVSGLAERLELDLGRRYREYSSGNKRKLGLLLAFMHPRDCWCSTSRPMAWIP